MYTKIFTGITCALLITLSGCAASRAVTPQVAESVAEISEEAAAAQDISRGDFSYLDGDVSVKKPGEQWEKAGAQTVIEDGDEIMLGEKAFAEISLSGSSSVQASEETSFAVTKTDDDILLELMYGALRAKVESLTPERLEIRTPVAVAAVRGTEFAVIYEKENTSFVEVYSGEVDLAQALSESDKLTLSKDSYASVTKDEAPLHLGIIPGINRLRWEQLGLRKKTGALIRKRVSLETDILRMSARAASLSDPADKELLEGKVSVMAQELEGVLQELTEAEEALGEMRSRYEEARREGAGARRELIEKRRQEKIDERERERRRLLEERRKRRAPR